LAPAEQQLLAGNADREMDFAEERNPAALPALGVKRVRAGAGGK
jgi:hypothetical protein